MKAAKQHPLPQLPTREELLFYLIREDLKSRRFFDGLRELGLGEAYYQSELCILILTYARLSVESDAVGNFYYHLLHKHAQHVQPNNSALNKAAGKVYKELMAFKKQQQS